MTVSMTLSLKVTSWLFWGTYSLRRHSTSGLRGTGFI